MLGKLIAAIVHFFIRQKWLFFSLLAGIILLLAIGVKKLQLNEDLYSIFPKTENYQEFSKIIQKNALNKQLVFSIKANEDEEVTLEQLEETATAISSSFEHKIAAIRYQRLVNERQLIAYFQAAAILQLNQNDYSRILEQLDQDSIQKAISACYNRISGSSVYFMKDIVAKDPLGLFNEQLKRLNPSKGKSEFEVKDGVVYTDKGRRALIFANIQVDFKDIKGLTHLRRKLDDFKINYNKKHPKIGLDYFGTFEIAVENSVQVQADTYLTSFLSVGLILLLLVLYYRSLLAPIYFILPAAFGALAGLGLTGYVHPNINAISIATSSVLLGIVLDYAFHFFTHLKHTGNVLTTVSEVSFPMVVGSFTTITALGALLYTNSVILQNFGMIALFTLSGSVIFTLVFLPVLVHVLKLRIPGSDQGENEGVINKKLVRVLLMATVVITGFFFYEASFAAFDSDLNNLSYHSDDLKRKEQLFTGVHPGKDKKFYVISNGANEQEVLQANYRIYERLQTLSGKLRITEIVSTAPYIPGKKQVEKSINKWSSFWKNRKEVTQHHIETAAGQTNFSAAAFTPFYKWMNEEHFPSQDGEELLNSIGLDALVHREKGELTLITSVVVNKADLNALKIELRKIDGIFILDISEMAEQMLSSVQTDFNYLLTFTALLVFFSLLVVYGRIELALFAFFPMVLSWIWILGITGLFDIKFNFINILVVTFIFGLGDDFSIFTTDGLIQQIKTGKSSIASYRSAILLSGICTIIGTGALIFAQHPAINSIALISIIGIGTILFNAVFVQPTIFRVFVSNRLTRKRVPVTFFTLMFSCMLFLYFFIGCILLNVFLFTILLPLPVRWKKKRQLLNYLVSKLTKSTIYAGIHIRKQVIDGHKLDYSKPKIIVANHSSFLDILLVLMLHPKTVIMVKSWVYHSPFFGLFIRVAGYPYAREGANGDIERIKQLISEGYSVVIFPEGTRSADGNMTRFHKGAFYLAQELQLDIQPVLILGAHEVNPKNDLLISRGKLIVKVLDTIPWNSEMDYSKLTKVTKNLMVTGMEKARWELLQANFWEPFLLKNYVFKGPILEWYVKVKWWLEKRNFEQYDLLIGDRSTIYDLGCGYGYLSYYLHYRSSKRNVIGIDYDHEKVEVAQNGIAFSEQLVFESADIRTVAYTDMDAVFLNDVLHYLPKSDQFELLELLHSKLSANGLILIREGINDTSNKFFMTQVTEWFSTKLFKFNKAENSLEFLTFAEISEFANKHGLIIDRTDHSKTTSNQLFVLRKPE